MTSQIYPFQKGTSHRDLIFTPGTEQNSEKKQLFIIPENVFSGPKLYPLNVLNR